MGLCSGAEREFACPTNGPTSTGTIMAPSSRRVRAKRSREGVPAFCTMPIIHSVQYIFAMFCTLRMKGPLEYVGQTGGSIHPSTLPFVVYPWREEDPIALCSRDLGESACDGSGPSNGQ